MINEKLCAKYDLTHGEVTLVMTDVEGSTELWDWYDHLTAQLSYLLLHAGSAYDSSILFASGSRSSLSNALNHNP